MTVEQHIFYGFAKMRPGAAFLIFIGFFVFFAQPARTEERCGVPDEVDQLIDTMSQIAATEGPLSKNTRATLNFQLNRVERLMAKDPTSDLGLGGWKSSFDWVFLRGKETLSAGHMNEPYSTHNRIGTLTVGLRFLCEARVSQSKALAQDSDTSAAAEEKNTKGQEEQRSFFDGSARSLATIVAIALAAIIVFWGGTILYKWLYALLNNRRSCHINGSLEIGLDVIDGSIVILGAKGARFRPVNDGAYARIEALVDVREPMVFPPVLQICDQRFAVNITAVFEGHICCFFCEPIDVKRQNELLENSTVRPRFARKDIPKCNVGLSD